MDNSKNFYPLDYTAIYQEIIKKSIKNDSSKILTLTMFLKNSGYSKKRIKSEIRKHKKQKKRLANHLGL